MRTIKIASDTVFGIFIKNVLLMWKFRERKYHETLGGICFFTDKFFRIRS